MSLRDYQSLAVMRTFGEWRDGIKATAVILPTGAGKTHVFSEVARRWVQGGAITSNRRVLVLAHRTELIAQAAERIRARVPGVRVGVVEGSTNDPLADIVVGSVLTLAGSRRRSQVTGVGLVIIDECHHATAETYQRILRHYGVLGHQPGTWGVGPGAVALGVTATMSRSDKHRLGDIWQTVAHQVPIVEMINSGWLVPPRPVYVRVKDLDLSKVKISAGDYAAGQLGEAVSESMAPSAVIEALRERAPGRQAILFTPTVELAELMASELNASGIRAESVYGALAKDDRAARLERYRDGDVQVLCNCMVLTEGTDLPSTGCIAIMRPTKSSSLFIQMVGRGLRIDPDNPAKKDCIVLDLVGATTQHTLSANVELFGERVRLSDSADGATDAALWDEPMEVDEPAATPNRPAFREGEITYEEADLFGARAGQVAWHRTGGGIWFVRLQGGYAAITPGGDLGCDVVIAPDSPGLRHKYLAVGAGSMADAQEILLGHLGPDDSMTTNAGASWRRKRASEAMIRRARVLRVDLPEDCSAGYASDLMASAEGTRRLDPLFARG